MKARKLAYKDLLKNYSFCEALQDLVAKPISDENFAEFRDIVKEYVQDSKNLLKEREYSIINTFLDSDNYLTLEDLGNRFGVSKSRAAQLIHIINRKLKNPEYLRKYNLFKRLENVSDEKTRDFVKNNLANLETRLHYSQPTILPEIISGLYAGLEKSLNNLKNKKELDQIQVYNQPIKDVSVRLACCLKEAGIKTLGELTERTESELLSYRNFGKKTLAEVKSLLQEKGLSLKY